MRTMELKDNFERILPIRLSGDFAVKSGRMVGKHPAMTAALASTTPQTTKLVISA